MENRIITISREFGSGGRSIGKEVARQLGRPYYDKELVKEVAAKSGFAPEFIEEQGEFAPSKSRLAMLFSGAGLAGSLNAHGVVGATAAMNGLSAYDYLWVIQRQVILELAEKEPCVIVGRCADYILRERPDALHVFVHADMAYRADRIVRLYGESEKSPEKRLEEKDAKRRINYKHFTDREWGMSQNYHLSLDSGYLGQERCVQMILDLVKPE